MTGVSLLWALRSPCNLGCRYCYFGTIEEHREAMPAQPGVLSHLARNDLDLATIAAFVQTLPASRVERIFLAGGEPLIWPPIMDVVAGIRAAGVQVVLCTNGIPLNRPELVEAILATGVDAVSVSLDSADAGYNDRWRPARNGVHGHRDVLAGIQALITARGGDRSPRVGIYSVITRQNIDAVTETAALAARLGCDYFVPQPIALDPEHALHQQLSLTPSDADALAVAFAQLYDAPPVRLPAPGYPGQVVDAITAERPGFVRGCFGGTDLFFIEPDGSVWDCPSTLKIRATAAGDGRRSIRDASATTLFGPGGACADCHLFSADCVNMWPLMGFTRFLPNGVPS
ncbi:radical SAM protein [Micromonospora narathiwatensis]|uniref:Radical SAM superfamily enzyme, MoaA/NifB/PqqE/SkfB family n=1 Tax=Micromonospora narathiwatensis TaxID=299146 RepID=A0A1A8ZA77_9ACTN|nr:radical SAM protein [Micromonospora narathiwatensis]SBT40773.1 Radical SAM superfamily enzyme, MoaA/NifB/PqqE/SkfB family [Micromonospora narathiwatensis]